MSYVPPYSSPYPVMEELDDQLGFLEIWLGKAPPGEDRLKAVKSSDHFLKTRDASVLDWNSLQLSQVPSEFFELVEVIKRLTQFSICRNKLTDLPTEIGGLTQLQNLSLSDNLLTVLPTEIGDLTQLQRLNLVDNLFTVLPPEIAVLPELTTLAFSKNKLTALPINSGDFPALTGLALARNQFAALPTELGTFTRLTSLYLGNNRLTSLPTELGALTGLTELCLDYNQLADLPTEMGALTALKNLYLPGNLFTDLPIAIGSLQNSCQVDLSSCPLYLSTVRKIQKKINVEWSQGQGPQIFYTKLETRQQVEISFKEYWFLLAIRQRV